MDVPNILGLSPLMSAAGAGQIRCVNLCVCVSLHVCACAYAHVIGYLVVTCYSVVEVLLNKGADVSYTNSSGRNW